MSNNLIDHPSHYTNYPDGLNAECIEYVRHMPFSQGAAFKYLFRLGAKDDSVQELGKASWFLRDAIEHGNYVNATLTPEFPRIDPNTTHRAKALHYIARGQLDVALRAIEHFGPRILDARESK